MTRFSHPTILFPCLGLLALITFVYALTVGSYPITWQDYSLLANGKGDPVARQVLFELRLPHVASSFIVGALLALAGALMQVLLRNPLADPYILGVSGGAALGALVSILMSFGIVLQQTTTFAGALLSMLLVFSLAKTHHINSPTRLLLTGVVVAAFWGALISFILTISPSQKIHSMLFWLMGDLRPRGFPMLPFIVLTVGLIVGLMIARALNLLTRGELSAKTMGVNTRYLQYLLYLLASLLTASAVLIAGTIGFIGLIIPHMLRLLGVTHHRVLLPGCVLLGGSFLTLADAFSRALLPYQQLPVGIITALIGVPIFLIILKKSVALP